MKSKVLFFSRGRGHGHAIPDIAITDEILTSGGDIEITFASYATGATTFIAAGKTVYNMGFPEKNPFLPTFFKAAQLIEELKPDVVLAHEEFAALPAAALCGVPAIYISAWFPPDNGIHSEALAYASSVIIIEEPGVFPLPIGLSVKPIYVGPLLRRMKFGLDDRLSLREEHAIGADFLVLVVVTGGFASEQNSPIMETILSAYVALDRPKKKLFWISAKDADLLKARTLGIPGVEVLSFVDPVERLLALADVVITKGTHLITLDCASIGVPSISLSPNINPIDDILVPRVRTNVALNARAVDSDILLHYINTALSAKVPTIRGDVGCKLTAATLRSEIRRLMNRDSVMDTALSTTV